MSGFEPDECGHPQWCGVNVSGLVSALRIGVAWLERPNADERDAATASQMREAAGEGILAAKQLANNAMSPVRRKGR